MLTLINNKENKTIESNYNNNIDNQDMQEAIELMDFNSSFRSKFDFKNSQPLSYYSK